MTNPVDAFDQSDKADVCFLMGEKERSSMVFWTFLILLFAGGVAGAHDRDMSPEHIVARAFYPVFRFDAGEENFPCSFDWMLERSELDYDGKILSGWGNTSLDTLHTWNDRVPYPERMALNVHPDSWSGNMWHSPVYAKVHVLQFENGRVRHAEIVYCINYAYNAASEVLGGLFRIGAHQGDIEHVRVVVHEDKVIRVFMSRHGEGRWVQSHELEWSNGRPVVYVARGSHAMFPRRGKFFRLCLLVSELCDGFGVEWMPSDVVLLSLRRTPWITYKGSMGLPNHGNMPAEHPWWTGREMETTEGRGATKWWNSATCGSNMLG